MKDICVPIPDFKEDQIADVEITTGGKKIKYNFRVESFPWDVEDELSVADDNISKSLARIARLKQSIETYDPAWQLIQIFNPSENSKHIQVLYRKKES